MDRLESSELCVANIVSLLAKNGVRKINFALDDVDVEDPGLFIDAVSWLENEGVIWSNEQKHKFTMSPVNALGFSLTSKGFSLLSKSFEGDLTLGQAIQKSSETGQGYANAGNLLGGILGSFTKAIGN